MKVFNNTTNKIFFSSWVSFCQADTTEGNTNQQYRSSLSRFDILKPLRRLLDNLQVRDRKLAHRLCKLIPSQCPFERDITLLGKKLFHIPPLCKLNPLYEELVGLRFRALCYLADECGEDISEYC